MTDRDMQKDRPNVAKLVNFINAQDETTQFAALLIAIASGILKGAES